MSFVTVLALLSLGTLLPTPTASQVGNTILPLSVNSRVQTATEEACPSNEVQSQIIQEVRTLLRDNIICLAAPTQATPAASCSAISTSCPSGYYWIRSSNGSAVQVYCAMDRVCGCSSTGGWARVAYLNTTDTSQQCPGNWTLMTTPRRLCGRTTNAAICDSAIFPSHGIEYSHVCGRVIGYQGQSPDAFDTFRRSSSMTVIDSYYIDGVSITHGDSGSRQHIWSFAAGFGTQVASLECPCNTNFGGTPGFVPSYVGDDFFCKTGNDNGIRPEELLFANDPLWDGQGCGTTHECECTFSNPPWFCKQLPQTSTDDIEIRICGDEPPDNEDTPVELIELYIR